MALLPYIGSVINLGNSFSQATRPRNVGQMSDLIQEYREVAGRPTVEGWESFYDQKIGSDKIDVAADKIWEYVQRIKENLNSLNRDDVKKAVECAKLSGDASALEQLGTAVRIATIRSHNRNRKVGVPDSSETNNLFSFRFDDFLDLFAH